MEQNQPVMAPAPVMVDDGRQGSGNGYKIATIIASIIAVAGVGFGVYGMMNNPDENYSDLKIQVESEDGTVTKIDTPKIETATGGETTVTIPDESISIATRAIADDIEHYIYVAQWGLKIKLPETLKSVSYEFHVEPGNTVLRVTAANCTDEFQCDYRPGFADMTDSKSVLGAVHRFPAGAEIPPFGIGNKIFTRGNYDFYYAHPQDVISTDEDEQKWELETTNLLMEALSDINNYSLL